MDIKQLRAEQEHLQIEFIELMNQWLEVFNRITDRMIDQSKKTEQMLKELRDD